MTQVIAPTSEFINLFLDTDIRSWRVDVVCQRLGSGGGGGGGGGGLSRYTSVSPPVRLARLTSMRFLTSSSSSQSAVTLKVKR
jgi:hypothetical protein